MIVSFSYKYQMEYILKTWSNLDIEGKGDWSVNSLELAKEYSISNSDFNDFLKRYFEYELGIEGDITFNEEDIRNLREYCIKYKNEN